MIAYHLGITERTVKAHLASIYNKLGVDSRSAAIAVAAQKGLIK
jgi:two-component system, NarL family, response regulator YdfI